MSDFVPDAPPGGVGYKTVAFEQAHLEDRLSGYTATKKVERYRREIIELLDKAGASAISIQRGYSVTQERVAYQLTFWWGAVDVRITQVTLPCRVDTERNREQAERQALYHLLNELRFELERRQFHPELPAFVTYMLAPGGNGEARPTVGEAIAEALPLALPQVEPTQIVLGPGGDT